MVKRGNLRCRQRHAEFQAQRLLLCGCAVHQIAHLVEIGADAVDIPTASLVEDGVADVTGIECRVTEETVIAIRVQPQTVEEICRAKELVPIGVGTVGLTRCIARLDAEHVIESIKQAVVHLPEAIKLRVHRYQIRAIGVGRWHEVTVITRRQRIVTAAAVLVGKG